jgi:hypothetical protein
MKNIRAVDEVIGPHSALYMQRAQVQLNAYIFFFLLSAKLIYLNALSNDLSAVDYDHFILYMCELVQKNGTLPVCLVNFYSLTHLKDARVKNAVERMGNINLIYFYYDEFH